MWDGRHRCTMQSGYQSTTAGDCAPCRLGWLSLNLLLGAVAQCGLAKCRLAGTAAFCGNTKEPQWSPKMHMSAASTPEISCGTCLRPCALGGRPDGTRAEIYLKREDLNHTGAHKINNSLGQVLLCLRMGKQRIIAETGAGQHGVATVSVLTCCSQTATRLAAGPASEHQGASQGVISAPLVVCLHGSAGGASTAADGATPGHCRPCFQLQC